MDRNYIIIKELNTLRTNHILHKNFWFWWVWCLTSSIVKYDIWSLAAGLARPVLLWASHSCWGDWWDSLASNKLPGARRGILNKQNQIPYTQLRTKRRPDSYSHGKVMICEDIPGVFHYHHDFMTPYSLDSSVVLSPDPGLKWFHADNDFNQDGLLAPPVAANR